jgi:hypothetical protein
MNSPAGAGSGLTEFGLGCVLGLGGFFFVLCAWVDGFFLTELSGLTEFGLGCVLGLMGGEAGSVLHIELELCAGL